MNLREQFEKLHPVPFGVVFADESYVPDNPFLSAEDWAIVRRLAETQNSLWQGFRSGRLFGLDEAREFTSKHEFAGEIAIEIDAAKEPK